MGVAVSASHKVHQGTTPAKVGQALVTVVGVVGRGALVLPPLPTLGVQLHVLPEGATPLPQAVQLRGFPGAATTATPSHTATERVHHHVAIRQPPLNTSRVSMSPTAGTNVITARPLRMP